MKVKIWKIEFYSTSKAPITDHMAVHSSFTKNKDSNPKTIYQFTAMYLVSNLTFQMPNKGKYMNILDNGNHIMGNLQTYGCSFPPIYIQLNNSQNKLILLI